MENGALRVAWSGTDAASGVDASTCTLEVQEDEGAWQPFSTACAGDEVHSAAQPGHVYTFRLSASDNVSNPASAEALARFPRVTKYYYFGGQRVAMRADGVVYYLHGDHLGSTSLTTNGSGAVVARQLYHPYGETRWSEGTNPTDFGYTGQRLDGTGLHYYHARYYHNGLARFVSADTAVPGLENPQNLNRYSYVLNSPCRYTDPTGHCIFAPPWDTLVCMAVGALLVFQGDTVDTDPSPEEEFFGKVGTGLIFAPATYMALDAAIQEAGWKLLDSVLRRRIVQAGGTIVAQELADGDDDEIRVAQELFDALQASEEGRIPLDKLDTSVIGGLQQLGEAWGKSEEFAVTMAEDGQMYLYQMSKWRAPLPLDTHWWVLHTEYGAGPLEPSGVDQVLLYASGVEHVQSYFSILTNNQGNSIFFLPYVKPGFIEGH